MNNTEPVLDHVSTTNGILQRLQEESRTWESESKDVWSALVKLRGNPLPRGDEVIIAKRIYVEYSRLKTELKKQHVTLGEFCRLAGLGNQGEYSKELHRLMLAPEADPTKVRPRRTASKYKDLIAAMAKVFGTSRLVLAEQLLRETSLYVGNSEERDEVEWIQENLQLSIDTVDAEFGLLNTFKETATLKAVHASEGGDCRWPQYEASYSRGLYEHDLLIARSLGKFSVNPETSQIEFLQHEAEIKREASRTELNVAMDVARAYWKEPITKRHNSFNSWAGGPTPSGCLQDDSFFYVPHAYLGHGDGVCNPIDPELGPEERELEIQQQRAQVLKSMEQFGAIPTDGWDESEKCPKGQTTSLALSAAHYHAWLIAYPTPDNTRLMPMLYMAVEECGPILVPLDSVTLSAMRKLYWFGMDGSTFTFLDRIKALLIEEPEGGGPLLEGLRRTAPWLKANPFFKSKQKKLDEIARLKSLHKALSDQLATMSRDPS